MGVSVRHLSKRFGAQEVLKDLSFDIADGEIVGLLGPNGAGKSTLMKILVGLLKPDGPAAHERPVSVEVPERIGYLPELNPLYPTMYVREYLRFMGALKEGKAYPQPLHEGKEVRPVTAERIEEVMERVGLMPEANKKIGELSKGYRQRVGLAQALLSEPQLLILDEPTTGLDPNQLEDIRALIRELGKDRTVILSTHILQEVKHICNRVIILDHGQIKADKPMSEVEDLETMFKSETLNG